MLPLSMRYSFKVDSDMIMVTGTHIPPAICLHTDHLDIPHHLREYSLIKGKEDWPKSRRPNQRSGLCLVFTTYFFSLSLPLLFPSLALFFSLTSSYLGSHAGLWREGWSTWGCIHLLIKTLPTTSRHCPDSTQGWGNKMYLLVMLAFLLRQWELENQSIAVFALVSRNLRTHFYN